MTGQGSAKAVMALGLTLALAGCENGNGLGNFTNPFKRSAETAEAPANAGSTRLVERDVEAPDVFQVSEAGLWDGRPSLGGVWVAHPSADGPERVIIRNTANGNFVIGALFHRERENPGPRLQVSSDAAEALGMLAGAPTQLNVTALRREEAPVIDEPVTVETGDLEAAPEVAETTLDPIGAAAAAIEAAPDPTEAAVATTAAAPAPAAAPTPAPKPRPASTLEKPFIQIGIFSVEANANRTAEMMRKAGIVPTVLKQTSRGKTFWRVIVGPARSTDERAALLKTVKAQGFADAYYVTN